MTDWLDRLLIALREARVDLSAEDVADAVWLTPHLDVPGRVAEEPGRELPEEPAGEVKPPPTQDVDRAEPESAPAPAPISEGPRRSGDRRGELHLPGDRAGTDSGGGRPLRAPTGAALPGSLALSRALRPLRRRVPSRTRRTLDVAETVRRVAEEGVWLPALRPARDRWLELSLVVDAGASMGPWRSAAKELLGVFSSLGAFRSVRVWSLETDPAPLRLRAGLANPGAARRDPRELVDPAGRSLIVVLTDCVAESWADGRAARLVEAWARSGPVALLQVLPEHLWTRSALGLASAVRLSAPSPAAANARLDSRPIDPWADPLERAGCPLPIASLTPQGLSAWAGVVAGAAGAEVPGYSLDLAPLVAPMAASSTPAPTPRERLERFWGAASPTARRLAGLLAASPAITLPVIRLVRQALLPEARQVHEAEVLLGDLLRIVDPPGPTERDPNEVRYDFREGLRTLLLDAVPAADALEVLGGVSAYVEENLAHGLDFRAMLADPAAARGSIVLDESPFARVAAEVLLRLGGDYARLVTALPEGRPSGPGTPGSPRSRSSQAPPLEDPPPLPDAPPFSRDRFQGKLAQVREPRVQMTYDVEFAGVTQKRELPFVIGVLADLSGKAGRRMSKPSDRNFLEINRDNFDEVMRAIAPRLILRSEDLFSGIEIANGSTWSDLIRSSLARKLELREASPTPGDAGPDDSDRKFESVVVLSFGSLRDFDPAAILDQLPELRSLYEERTSELEKALEDAGHETFRYANVVAQLFHDAIPGVFSGLMRKFLHHPDFKRLEATWRGLHYLVHQVVTGPGLKIKILDVSKRELEMDREKKAGIEQTSLYKCIYASECDPLGDEPFGLLVGDYEFDRSDPDLSLLSCLSRVAAAADVPFVAAAGAEMFNVASFEAWHSRGKKHESLDLPDSAKWMAFRESGESRSVALVLPRVLGRVPYGASTRPIEAFPFEELTDPARHDQYLWMSAAWPFAARVADAMAKHGWPAAIRGVEGGGLVDDLEVLNVSDDRGIIVSRRPTETLIGDRREVGLAQAGFIALSPLSNTGRAAFLSVPSCHRPTIYDQPEATEASARTSQLDAVLCISRFVQYLKFIGRAKAGEFPSAGGMQALLNTMLQTYISDDPEASADSRSKYPLADARVKIEGFPGKPGHFQVFLHIKFALYPEKALVSSRVEFQISANGP